MEFDLTAFTLAPTVEVFNSCRKKDLILIAEFFDIQIQRDTTKQVLKESLYEKLIAAGILPRQAGDDGELQTGVAGSAEIVRDADQEVGLSPNFDSVPHEMIAIKLKEMDLLIKKQECEAEMIRFRMLEKQADRDIEMRKLDLESERLARTPVPHIRPNAVSSPVIMAGSTVTEDFSHTVSSESFDVSKYIRLVPPFREAEVDSYFIAFERIASKLKWPKEMWALLLQCSLTGKAQEVCSALPIEGSLDYETVKSAVLRAYELVPEAYRQKFRGQMKTVKQTYVEFVREKKVLFEKWCFSSRVASLEELQELILLEEFKNCLPSNIVVYLNEQKVTSLANAAVLADEFVLTHKNVFSSGATVKSQVWNSENSVQRVTRSFKGDVPRKSNEGTDKRVCFFCLDPNHRIADCKAWKQKSGASKPKNVALVESVCVSSDKGETYQPFLFRGTVSLLPDSEFKPVTILRDTGAAQSFISAEVLPFSETSFTGNEVLVRGIGMRCVNVPLHTAYLKSDIVSGLVNFAVREQLPVEGVDLILGNDLAGGIVFPTPIVTYMPKTSQNCDLAEKFPSVFPSCVVTRAQAQKFKEVVDLSNSFLANDMPKASECTLFVAPDYDVDIPSVDEEIDTQTSLKVGRESLAAAQRADASLAKCIKAAESSVYDSNSGVVYFWEEGLLMRKWKPRQEELGWQEVQQIVLPSNYRQQVLKLAHEHLLSGHVGITKTYYRVSRYFFWPGLKNSVTKFCKSCHVCQIASKPNQKIPPAPLCPIPVVNDPFDRLIIDCVGPLPKGKAGHQYILTIMCAATRFVEAIPLRTLRAKVVVKELLKFCTTFGLPRIIQSDQGSNFTSKVFKQALQMLGIGHQMSTAFHPESQGALERFHQTLKAMLRRYCVETGGDWVEGLPYLMFASRETVQESLGFSPTELVFGHTVRGPLKLLSDQLLSPSPKPVPVDEYVTSIREKLCKARDLAKLHLSEAQSKMKDRFEIKSVKRDFSPGDQVLVLLPTPGSILQAKFAGPYLIERKLNETNYVVATPERRCKRRVCHVNRLKAYVSRTSSEESIHQIGSPLACAAATVSVVVKSSTEEEGFQGGDYSIFPTRLQNSAILQDLSGFLSHLTVEQSHDLMDLLSNFSTLFRDVPGRTSVCVHDIDVGDANPIKQHPYRLNPRKREVMQAEVDYLLRHGMAVPSQSPWSSPCLLVPKPDSTFRFCTDYRKVNNITKPDSFPLPRIEDCVDKVGSARYVTKLDLLKGYWQVPLTRRASEISAFVTPDSFLQYTVLAFGMRNAPATFQRMMHQVLSGVPDCEVYLDDIVIHSDDWVQHLETLKGVCKRLETASLTLNLAKCEFAKGTITYLGKQVGQGLVKPVDAKITAILQFPVPSNKRELRRFLGMSGYYRAFCPNFSTLVCPLTDLLSTKREFVWSTDCQFAFEAAKDLLCQAPVLSAPDFSKSFKLQVDASNNGAGAVLLQEDQACVEHPVSYFSRKFVGAQRNYSVIEKEALALLLSLKHFDVYLGNSISPVVVYTDHNPLVFLSRMSGANQRLLRWSLTLQEYSLDIRHKKGVENVMADALSRV
ncbi:hypothetical protein M9458_050710 [Cirrhinus mrigala]|uniref:Gypsy retrotransposon integrase-like protein 1 n=1 Tax=Cirrhinus mrigala TaxID=683832 RepID=A0ABD0MVA7_CIRMR